MDADGRIRRASPVVKRKEGWRRVVFASDCDDDGNCPVCRIDYADCDCPGPTMDEYEYVERKDGLYARRKDQPCTSRRA